MVTETQIESNFNAYSNFLKFIEILLYQSQVKSLRKFTKFLKRGENTQKVKWS